MPNDKITYRWTRSEKRTGLSTVGYDNRKRPWYLTKTTPDGLKDHVCTISNDSASWRACGVQPEDEWVATFLVRKPEFKRFTLKRRFTTEEIPEAKKFIRAAYKKFLKEHPESNEENP